MLLAVEGAPLVDVEQKHTKKHAWSRKEGLMRNLLSRGVCKTCFSSRGWQDDSCDEFVFVAC